MLEAEDSAIVLVHDSWHGAWQWDEVVSYLQERGWASIGLDLPGHGAAYREGVVTAKYSLSLYARALTSYVEGLAKLNPFKHLVVVAHGTAGAVLQYAAPVLAKLGMPALSGGVFLGGYVLKDGESITDNMPPEFAQAMTQLAQGRSDGRVPMEGLPDYWYSNVMSDEPRRTAELLVRLNPEPFAPLAEKAVGLQAGFYSLATPLAYINFNHDMSLPQGDFHPKMSSKLGKYRYLAVNAGHQAPLTKPREVAEAIIFLCSEF